MKPPFRFADKVCWDEPAEAHHVGVVTRVVEIGQLVVVVWDDGREVGYPFDESRLKLLPGPLVSPYKIRRDSHGDFVVVREHKGTGAVVAGPYANRANALRQAAILTVSALSIEIPEIPEVSS